jgi:hypothetical protein
MNLFKECLDECGLADLGYSGPLYTWSNQQDADSLVRVRLDRAVANDSFSSIYDDCLVENIITTTSDHFAILVRLQSFGESTERRPVQTGFRYEAAWQRAPDYNQTMEKAWTDGQDGQHCLHSTWAKLQSVAASLQEWSHASFGRVRQEIRKLERELKIIRLSP